MMRLFAVVLGLVVLASCTQKREDMKSPCVGADGSPCVKRNVNDGWMS